MVELFVLHLAVLLGSYISLADHEDIQRGKYDTFSVFVVKLYGFCLSIAYIAHPHQTYI